MAEQQHTLLGLVGGGDGEVGKSIAIEVDHGDLESALSGRNVVVRLERPVALSQEDLDIEILGCDGQIRHAVEVQIGSDHEATLDVVESLENEASIACPEKDRDAVARLRDHKVDLAIGVEISGGNPVG